MRFCAIYGISRPPTAPNVRELASSGKHAPATAALEEKLAQRTKELQAANALIEQRANELAVINSVQAALAAKLDMQGIYDAVGDKIREIFRRADVEIRIVDRQADVWRFLAHLTDAHVLDASSPARFTRRSSR